MNAVPYPLGLKYPKMVWNAVKTSQLKTLSLFRIQFLKCLHAQVINLKDTSKISLSLYKRLFFYLASLKCGDFLEFNQTLMALKIIRKKSVIQ